MCPTICSRRRSIRVCRSSLLRIAVRPLIALAIIVMVVKIGIDVLLATLLRKHRLLPGVAPGRCLLGRRRSRRIRKSIDIGRLPS